MTRTRQECAAMRKKSDGRCIVCNGSMEHKLARAIYCSNRCKQEVKYWNNPDKYRTEKREAYHKTKEKA